MLLTRNMGEAWKLFEKRSSFGNRGALDRKALSLLKMDLKKHSVHRMKETYRIKMSVKFQYSVAEYFGRSM
jgi:hypothetical protein